MYNPFKRSYLYFVAYRADNDKSYANGNYRVWRNTKIKTEADFKELEHDVKSWAVSDCTTLDISKQFSPDNIVIMNVQLLH